MPVSQFNGIAQRLKSFFEPDPEQVRTRDVIRNLPESLKDVGTKLGNFFVQSGQATWRGYGALGQLISTRGESSEFMPQGQFQKKLFGTDQSFSLRSVGEEIPGVKGRKAAPFVGAALGISDLIPGGSQAKQGLKLLREVNKTDDAFKILKSAFKFSDDIAKKYAPKFASLTDEAKISGLLDEAVKETGSIAKKGKRVAQTLRERGFVTSVKEAFPDASSKVAGQYIPKPNDELVRTARKLIQDDFLKAEHLAKTGIDDVAVATADELIRHYADAAANASDTLIKASMEDKMAEIVNPLAKALTEHGRSVQAASLLGKMTPEGQIRFAAREIQKYNEIVKQTKLPFMKEIPELTGKQIGTITDKMNEIASLPDGIQKAEEFQKLQKEIFEMVPSPLFKKIVTVWKAGLLTGIKTSGLNIFANVAHAITETAKEVPAAIVDSVASLFTGKRTLAFTLKGTGSGITEGFEKGWKFFRSGFDERNIAQKFDYKNVSFGKSVFARSIKKYEETIFRILGAEDQPFYYGAKARSLYSQAIAQGKNLGLKADELTEFVSDMVKSPTDDMLKYAAVDAETAVFQNKTALGKAARAIQKIGGERLPIGEIFVPFSRTPSSVATQVINYSPVGLVKTIVQNMGKGKFDQRLFAQGMGRGITGTGFLYLGTKLYDNDLVTLDYPKGEREQEVLKAEGRKPNTIKIGDKWRSIQSLGPAGSLLIVGAHFQEAYKDTGSPIAGIYKAFTGGAKSFTEQTFLQGVRSFVEAWDDPERYADAYFGNLLASGVPTIVSDVARAKDGTERRARTAIERVKARTPFLREELEPQVDVFGKERVVGGNFLETMIDPTRPTKEISTPLIEELRRLSKAGFKVSPTLLGDKKGYSALTPEQNTDLLKRAGQITESKMTTLINSTRYQKLADDEKAKKIDEFANKAKIVARAEKVLELTQDLSGEALKEKLAELKASGLMIRAVFEKYKDLR